MSCVSKVKRQGKDESSAYAICSKSTGWKRHKGGGWKKGSKVYKEATKTHLPLFDRLLESIKKGFKF